MEDAWRHAGRRGRAGIEKLIAAVDREQLGRRSRDPHEARHPSTSTRKFVLVSPAGIRSAVTDRPAQSGIAAMTSSIEGVAVIASTEELPLDRLGQPRLEALARPPPSMDEEMEETGVDQDPQDVGSGFQVEPVAEAAALADKIADDPAGADPAFGADRLEVSRTSGSALAAPRTTS